MLQSGGGLGPHPGGNLGGHQLPGREAGAVQGAVCAALQPALTRATVSEGPDIQGRGVRGQVSEHVDGARGVRHLGEPPLHVLLVLVALV